MRKSLLPLIVFGVFAFSVGCTEKVVRRMPAGAVTDQSGDCENLRLLIRRDDPHCYSNIANNNPPIDRFEKEILAFEAADKTDFTGHADVLFIGSSSIRLWNIEKYFPDLNAINRGFGGSCINESVYYFDRIVLPYAPRVIVFYAGDNDIAMGKSPETVFDDFRQFVSKTKSALPRTRIIYISIKPSIARWEQWPCMKLANCLIAQYCDADPLLAFADISNVMLNENGRPRRELFRPDGLHLNEEGYQRWKEVLEVYLQSENMEN